MVKAILLALSLAAGLLFGHTSTKANPSVTGPGVLPPPTCGMDLCPKK